MQFYAPFLYIMLDYPLMLVDTNYARYYASINVCLPNDYTSM